MCNNTKQRIADVVEELICTQPVGKITVQQVMELTQMNRQSFYYHYQDIHDVLQRIIQQKFCRPLAFDPQEQVEDWCRRGLTLLKDNRLLLKRITRELGSDKMYALVQPIIRPQVDRLLPTGADPQVRVLAAETVCHSILYSVTGLIFKPQPLDVEQSLEKLRSVIAVLRTHPFHP